MKTRVEFTVLGKPQPAGSKRGIPIYRKGKQFTGKVAVVDANKRSKPWQAEIRAAAREAMGDSPLLGYALILEVDFYVARPRGHYRTGRHAGELRHTVPLYPAVRPDATKLLRAIEDAMTGLVWIDDAQVVTQVARKRYGSPERAEILVETAVPTLAELDDWRGERSWKERQT
jgi:Holliday junction resolvase RusA-like endonuclease